MDLEPVAGVVHLSGTARSRPRRGRPRSSRDPPRRRAVRVAPLPEKWDGGGKPWHLSQNAFLSWWQRRQSSSLTSACLPCSFMKSGACSEAGGVVWQKLAVVGRALLVVAHGAGDHADAVLAGPAACARPCRGSRRTAGCAARGAARGSCARRPSRRGCLQSGWHSRQLALVGSGPSRGCSACRGSRPTRSLASVRRHLTTRRRRAGCGTSVQSMPLWAEAASVFSAGFMALQDVQYDWCPWRRRAARGWR